MCNISCNRQLNMDREDIATIAPQIGLGLGLGARCSTSASRIIVESKCSVGGWNEIQIFILKHIIVYLNTCSKKKNVLLIIWVNKMCFCFIPFCIHQSPYFWPSNCWEPENTDYGESVFASFSKPVRSYQFCQLFLFKHFLRHRVQWIWFSIDLHGHLCNVSGPEGSPRERMKQTTIKLNNGTFVDMTTCLCDV